MGQLTLISAENTPLLCHLHVGLLSSSHGGFVSSTHPLCIASLYDGLQLLVSLKRTSWVQSQHILWESNIATRRRNSQATASHLHLFLILPRVPVLHLQRFFLTPGLERLYAYAFQVQRKEMGSSNKETIKRPRESTAKPGINVAAFKTVSLPSQIEKQTLI